MTRARVGKKNPDGTVTSMYVHNDGYPEKPGVGWELLRGYSTPSLVEPLIAVGELSGLESTLRASHKYTDARAPVTHPVGEWPESGQEHEYLFEREGVWFHRADGAWRLFGSGAPIEADWKPLSEVVGASS